MQHFLLLYFLVQIFDKLTVCSVIHLWDRDAAFAVVRVILFLNPSLAVGFL